MQTSVLVILIIILLLMNKRRHKKNMKITAKKLIIGFILTIVFINVIFSLLM